jgi:hypothetical protein
MTYSIGFSLIKSRQQSATAPGRMTISTLMPFGALEAAYSKIPLETAYQAAHQVPRYASGHYRISNDGSPCVASGRQAPHRFGNMS